VPAEGPVKLVIRIEPTERPKLTSARIDIHEPVPEAIGLLCVIQLVSEVSKGDMTDNGNVSSGSSLGTVLAEVPEILTVPCIPEHWTQRRRIAFHHAQRTGELGLDHEESLVRDSSIRRPPTATRFLLGVADVVDESFSTLKPRPNLHSDTRVLYQVFDV